MAAKSTATAIVIPAINIQYLSLTIIGDSPLIVHKWSDKAKKEILDKQIKKAPKDPVREFINSIYWLEGEPEEKTEEGFAKAIENGNAKFGFPSTAIKAAAVSAGYRAGITRDKVSTNAAFHINGEFVEIQGIPVMREDIVKVAWGAADIRYRGEFKEWQSEVTIRYNANAISAEQIIGLFNLAGFACGIGEWRPEKGGTFGMYHVKNQMLDNALNELKAFKTKYEGLTELAEVFEAIHMTGGGISVGQIDLEIERPVVTS